jgi:hypothetical protein
MSRGKLIAVDHIGGEQQEVVVREQVLSEKHTIRFVFHDFEKLPHERELDTTTSSVVLCHGYKWKLELSPGGDYLSGEDEVYIAICLYCVSLESDNRLQSKDKIRISDTIG